MNRHRANKNGRSQKASRKVKGKSAKLCTSSFRGVSFKKKESKWVSQIKYKGVQHYLGK